MRLEEILRKARSAACYRVRGRPLSAWAVVTVGEIWPRNSLVSKAYEPPTRERFGDSSLTRSRAFRHRRCRLYPSDVQLTVDIAPIVAPSAPAPMRGLFDLSSNRRAGMSARLGSTKSEC